VALRLSFVASSNTTYKITQISSSIHILLIVYLSTSSYTERLFCATVLSQLRPILLAFIMLKKIDLLYPLLALLLVLSPLSVGQEISSNLTPSDAYDCTIVELDAVDEASLTTAERIALMDVSLFDSIDKHDNCIDQVVSDNAASGSGQGSGAGLAGGGLEGADGENIEGENSSDVSAGENGSRQSENTTEQANSEDTTNKQRDNINQADGNGAKNQDIAVKDNDTAVCRLLKDELKIETDPKKQSELKEIYNSYQCRG
jgi:hypothetical protein